MLVENRYSPLSENAVAVKGWVFLVVTTAKQLYIVKQTGQRSWDAFNLDMIAGMDFEDEYIHGNRATILQEVRNTVHVENIFQFNNKIGLRKAIMEFQAYGTIGRQAFVVEKTIP